MDVFKFIHIHAMCSHLTLKVYNWISPRAEATEVEEKQRTNRVINMKRGRNFLLLLTFILSLSISSHGWQNGAHKHGKHGKQKDHHNSSAPPPHSHYDIRSFGAVGDGVSDDSEVWELYINLYKFV